jgi:hypothetical protein
MLNKIALVDQEYRQYIFVGTNRNIALLTLTLGTQKCYEHSNICNVDFKFEDRG